MEAFDYSAFDGEGKKLKGTIMASNARDARDMLRGRSLVPVDLAPSKSKQKKNTASSVGGRVKHRDLTQATRQLAILLETATPVEEALRVTALNFEDSAMRPRLLGVRSQVMEGLRLSEAMAGYDKAFSELYRAMVGAGETSGRLAAVLDRLAEDLEAAQRIRRKVMGATVYPLLLTIVSLIIVAILLTFVVPQLVKSFSSLGQDLPWLTRAAIALSDWVKAYGIIAFMAVSAAVFGFRQMLKRETFRLGYDGVILKLPLIGRINRTVNAARFSRTMAGLIDSGTPALAALEASRHTMRNSVMRKAMGDVAVKVREGSAISRALKHEDVLPPLIVQMVAGGEASGDLARMFAKSADYLEEEFDTTTTVLLNLMGPLIIMVLGGFVLLIIAAIFMPIVQMNTLLV